MSAWLLLMVLLAPANGLDSSYLLNKFDTQEECQTERNRIGFDMAEAYPYEADFRIECHERRAKVTKVSQPDEPITEYDEIIKDFAKKRYPKQHLDIKVMNDKTLQNEAGVLPIRAIQVHISHKDGIQSFILLIKNNLVIGWIDAGEAVEADADEEEEIFPSKDQA